MSVRKLNVLTCELDESLDRAGFRHAAAAIGQRIGAERLGAAVYDAEAGHPIWPYHYHCAAEEWLYVISGAPVLRDAGGERTLRSGDLICFPAGHLGAHTVHGPGRFILFSTDAPGPYIAAYPDSDKVAVAFDDAAVDVLMLPRSAAVDYWYGEGSEPPSDPVVVRREPAASGRPVVNALTVPLRSQAAMLGPELGAAQLDVTVLQLDPGHGSADYHYTYGREEWVLVLAGTPALRHSNGEDALEAGDMVCFPDGPAGAHRLINRSDRAARVVFLATTGFPANVCYPDSGRWSLRNGPDAEDVIL
ncbi:MAG TPA: cupin domain-containing protein [Gaiellales bacterium]